MPRSRWHGGTLVWITPSRFIVLRQGLLHCQCWGRACARRPSPPAQVSLRASRRRSGSPRARRGLWAHRRGPSQDQDTRPSRAGTRRHALSSSTTTAGMNVLELRAARLEGGAGSAVSSFLSDWMNLRPAARTLRDVRARLQRSAHGSRTVR